MALLISDDLVVSLCLCWPGGRGGGICGSRLGMLSKCIWSCRSSQLQSELRYTPCLIIPGCKLSRPAGWEWCQKHKRASGSMASLLSPRLGQVHCHFCPHSFDYKIQIAEPKVERWGGILSPQEGLQSQIVMGMDTGSHIQGGGQKLNLP